MDYITKMHSQKSLFEAGKEILAGVSVGLVLFLMACVVFYVNHWFLYFYFLFLGPFIFGSIVFVLSNPILGKKIQTEDFLFVFILILLTIIFLVSRKHEYSFGHLVIFSCSVAIFNCYKIKIFLDSFSGLLSDFFDKIIGPCLFILEYLQQSSSSKLND